MGERDISASLVAELISAQFPEWADRPVRPVEVGGWDHRTFRLGDDLVVRLPRRAACAAQIDKERRWLPLLAPSVPLPIPEPVGDGRPSDLYPYPWSVRRWLPGEPMLGAAVVDLVEVATDLAGFLVSLRGVDTSGGPQPGAHNFLRGGSLSAYDTETRDALAVLGPDIDRRRTERVWDAALETRWDAPAVWVHGDVAPSNLLVGNGRISAVIDFGGCAVGDPACDLTMAWTTFAGKSRDVFRARIGLDDGTWARAAGWVLWKALVTLLDGRLGGEAARGRFGWRLPVAGVLHDLLEGR